jgi:hypothetical protein
LEEDAQFEFGDGLAAELAEEVGVGVAGEDDVATEVTALGDEAVEDEAGVFGGGVGVEGEGCVLVVAEFFVVLDAVDEEEELGLVRGGVFGALLDFGQEGAEGVVGVGGSDEVGGVWELGQEVLEQAGFGCVGRAGIEEVEACGVAGELGGEHDGGEGEHGEGGFVAGPDDEEVIPALAAEGDFGGALDGVGFAEPESRCG